jgi:DNA-binding transcriptional LysR family regulator
VRVIGGLDVVVTAPYALGATLLGDVVTRFIARYPDIRVDADFSNRNVDIVAEGFDLAVRGDPGVRSDSSLTIKKLASATVGFNAAPSYIARTGTPRSVGGQTARALRLLDALRGFPLYPK